MKKLDELKLEGLMALGLKKEQVEIEEANLNLLGFFETLENIDRRLKTQAAVGKEAGHD